MRSGSATEVPPNFWTSSHGSPGYRRPRVSPERDSAGYILRPCRAADKRSPQEGERAAAREQREAAEKRSASASRRRSRDRHRRGRVRGPHRDPQRRAAASKKKSEAPTTTTSLPAVLNGCKTLTRRQGQAAVVQSKRRPVTIDPTKTYVATVDDVVRHVRDHARHQERTQGRRATSCSSPSRASTTGSTWHRVAKDFVIQGGDPDGDHGSGDAGYSIDDRDAAPTGTTVGTRRDGRRPAPHPRATPARSSSS